MICRNEMVEEFLTLLSMMLCLFFIQATLFSFKTVQTGSHIDVWALLLSNVFARGVLLVLRSIATRYWNCDSVSFAQKATQEEAMLNDTAHSTIHSDDSFFAQKATKEEAILNDTVHSTIYLDDSFNHHYELGEQLGQGAFSTVKSGIHRLTQKAFAIKVVTKSKMLEQEQERLEYEVALMKEISHPNIVGLRDFFDQHQYYYLVMEKMSGGDLLSHLEKASFFEEAQAQGIVKSIIDAVAYLHSKQIAHRDLKPENILLESSLNQNNTSTPMNKPIIKLTDFGFAKKQNKVDSFRTICGTPAYVAPEILTSQPYGLKADMWGIGVIVYILLSGYQPFRGNEEELKQNICQGIFKFHPQYWKSISAEAKIFISDLLKYEPSKRLSAQDALAQHQPWFSLNLNTKTKIEQEADPVFFMIGSQRSGSNWLRTMIDEREDVAGPHPPHIMRDFMSNINKFGPLDNDQNFRVLVDHVCTFVERNQVPWTDMHERNINFPRNDIFCKAHESCKRLIHTRFTYNQDPEPLESGLYLLSIFDAVMCHYTTLNGKRLWMCKSMGMSMFHDMLIEFYGEKRLRYIYLVRDPRDVAMSFMKTPVGDCHYFAIAEKWTKLQTHALRIIDQCPHLVHQIHYEDILEDKRNTVQKLYDFIGERRFGGIKHQASVLFMAPVEDLLDRSRNGRESLKACHLSYQFQNLHRGASFIKLQHQKWKHPDNGLNQTDIQLIETVAEQVMKKLGYEPHLVGIKTDPTIFTKQDLAIFDTLNKKGIGHMYEKLKRENPGDFYRRQHQAEVLQFQPTIVDESKWSEGGPSVNSRFDGTVPMNYLSQLEMDKRLNIEKSRSICLSNHRPYRFSSATQQGYYPDDPHKINQDRSLIKIVEAKQDGPSIWFSVFDGHGPYGHLCSEYAASNILKLVEKHICLGSTAHNAIKQAHQIAHERLTCNRDIDTIQSGTTATSVLLKGDSFIVSNVGDSSCILGYQKSNSEMGAKVLCTEHTPLQSDELDRIKKAGGLVMTTEQRDGMEALHQKWTTDNPPRVWANSKEKFPGCGFTRSIGDDAAHTVGVTALPELFEYKLHSEDRILIVATDGITEFMDSATCVKIASKYKDPSEAAHALIQESSKRWMTKSNYVDDITVIVVFLGDGIRMVALGA